MKVPVLIPKIFDYPFTYNSIQKNKLNPGDLVMVPFGKNQEIGVVWDKLHETDKKIKTKYPKYIVKKGETLFGISKKHNISVENIQKWNNLKTNTLEIGQELIIQKR